VEPEDFYVGIIEDVQAEGIVLQWAQWFLDGCAQGRLKEARVILLRLGIQLLGPPEPETIRAVRLMTEVKAVEDLIDRLLLVAGWNELLVPGVGTVDDRPGLPASQGSPTP